MTCKRCTADSRKWKLKAAWSRPNETADAYGQPVSGKTELGNLRGSFRSLTANEVISAQSVYGSGTASFETRYRQDVITGDLLMIRTRLWAVVGIKRDENNQQSMELIIRGSS